MNLPGPPQLDAVLIFDELELIGKLFVQITVLTAVLAVVYRKGLLRGIYSLVAAYVLLAHVILLRRVGLESFGDYSMRIGTNLVALGALIYSLTSTVFLVYVSILLLQFYRSREDAGAFESFTRYIFRPLLLLTFAIVSILVSRTFVLIGLVNVKALTESEVYRDLFENRV